MRVADMLLWINERENIRVRKEAGMPPPWSNDPVMANTRWCNVHREDDKVTKYIAAHGWRDGPLWKAVLARMINYIPSLETMENHWEFYGENEDMLDVFKGALVHRRGLGEKVFTSAYTISTCGRKMDKLDYVSMVIRDVQAEQKNITATTCDGFHKELMVVDGLGSFLAAQVVADLKNSPGHVLQQAPDRYSFAAPGPGSLRGLAAFYGRPVTPRTFTKDLFEAWNLCHGVDPTVMNGIDMQDFQNCMCEFSKYDRIKKGGHARNRYEAGHD